MPDNSQYPSPSSQPDSNSNPLWQGLLQADTFVRSAANAATFGLADDAAAAADATLGQGGPGNWLDRYRANLQQQTQRDVYDAYHRGVAQGLGNSFGNAVMAFEGGTEASARLPMKAKGQLGEALSNAKTYALGDKPVGWQKRVYLNDGKYTVADQVTANGKTVEAKFGNSTTLSPRQRQAQSEFGSNYRADFWRPRHVGYGTGVLGAAVGPAINGPLDNDDNDDGTD